MNKDTLKGQWKQFTGSIKERWGKLTDDDLTESQGNYEQLVGKLQERYGYQRERAEREVNDWMETERR
ncbi:MAG: CsbD family protein [Caldilineaceae bacterium]